MRPKQPINLPLQSVKVKFAAHVPAEGERKASEQLPSPSYTINQSHQDDAFDGLPEVPILSRKNEVPKIRYKHPEIDPINGRV